MITTEYEIKILDINLEEIRQNLKKLWANFVGVKNFRRYVYSFTPAVYHKWVRLRTDGKKTTLCIKEIQDESKIDGTKETEIIVNDFEITHIFLEKLGYHYKAYQENIRESYLLDWCEIELDQRPKIPPYLEIEWKSVEAVQNVMKKMELENHIYTSENTTAVYRRYWIKDLESYKELKF